MMEESKKYSKVYALMLIVSIFAGWQVMLLVAALLLIFGKVEESVKKMAITVITFAAGIALFSLFWDLITGGVALVTNGIESLVTFLNSYLDNPITIIKLQRYLINPITIVVNFLDTVIKYAIMFMRFCFVVAILKGAEIKSNFIFDKINTFVQRFVDFVSEKTNSKTTDDNKS